MIKSKEKAPFLKRGVCKIYAVCTSRRRNHLRYLLAGFLQLVLANSFPVLEKITAVHIPTMTYMNTNGEINMSNISNGAAITNIIISAARRISSIAAESRVCSMFFVAYAYPIQVGTATMSNAFIIIRTIMLVSGDIMLILSLVQPLRFVRPRSRMTLDKFTPNLDRKS